ncbi:hypothetical protein TIFTF001_030947 [Ficus carica]|uniref:Uncharacterized protein n=1 Tax=Ficus carica TaxID=3494 RepID=A0AA88DU51_FICCA|nr:hypothetical protein TIFTF001_030947 [Ficus carica]
MCAYVVVFPGTEIVQGMSLNSHELESDLELDPLVFKAMFNLKYLSVTHYYCTTKRSNLPQGLRFLPDELRYLCWNHYPLRTLPPNFKPQNLVELNLWRSKLEKLWDGVQNFGSLKVLHLEESENLIEIPNLSQALKVEKIYLTGCTSLKRLPSSIGKLKSLQLLHLDRCSKLEYLPEISEPMPNLRMLNLSESGIIGLPKSIYNLIGIESLVLNGCQNLKSLPTSIRELKSLKELRLSFCSKLEYLPEILEPMPNLRVLELSESGIIDLPKSIYNLIGIESFVLNECQNLKSLPTTICLPESIYNLIGIESLVLIGCQNLRSLPTSIPELKSLKELRLSFCSKLEHLPEILEPMPNLKVLDLSESGIKDLPKSTYNLIGIESLVLNECQKSQESSNQHLILEQLRHFQYDLPVRAALKHACDTSCPLCGSGLESAIHLFLFGKRVRLLWFMSQWHLRTDSLLYDSMASFLEIVLDRNYDRDFLVYASLLVDTVWRARN